MLIKSYERVNNDLDAKILYVSMTRAMHSLDIYYEDTLSGLLN